MLIADYWFVRQKKLALADLYLETGEYRYWRGWNWRAVVATLAGCGMAWGVPALRIYGWFVGFGTAFIVHLVLMKISVPEPSPRLRGEGAA